jgi:hypothetical protein
MAMDKEVKKALEAATKELSQSDEVAIKLISWLDDLSDGKTTILRKDEINRYIESILDSVVYNYEGKTSVIERILNQTDLG